MKIFEISLIVLMVISTVSTISAVPINKNSTVKITTNSIDTGNNKVAGGGEIKYNYWCNKGGADKYKAYIGKGMSLTQERPFIYSDHNSEYCLDHIDYNSQSAGFNAEVSHIDSFFYYIKQLCPDSYNYRLTVDVVFFKPGKAYKNKIYKVTAEYIGDGKYNTVTSGPIDVRTYDMRKIKFND